MKERRRSVEGRVLRINEREIGVLDWGGEGPIVLMLHPNGFCAGIFDPIARALPGSFRPVAVDLAGHGRSSSIANDSELTFAAMAGYVAAATDQLGIDRAFVVGCSLGGGVSILLDKLRPELATGMLLCEAGAFPEGSRPERNPMADRLRRRRREWPDRGAADAALRGRGAMSDLADDAFDAYLSWGFDDHGGQQRLLCDPTTEAAIADLSHAPYGARAAWAHLPNLSTPNVTLVAGQHSFLPIDLIVAQAVLLRAPLYVGPKGHLTFFSDSAWAAELIELSAAQAAQSNRLT